MKDYLSFSRLKNMAISPAYFKWCEENPKGETPAMRFGKRYHEFIEKMGKINWPIYDPEDRPEPDKTMASKLNKEWAAGFGEDAVHIDEYRTIQAMYLRLVSDPYVSKILAQDGKAEMKVEFEIEGVNFKGILDRVNDRFFIDWKTIGKQPTDYAVGRAVQDYMLYLQAGIYSLGVGITGCCFVFQSTVEPYDVQPVMLSDDYLQFGRDEAIRLVELWKKCKDNDNWPGISEMNGVIELDKPAYL